MAKHQREKNSASGNSKILRIIFHKKIHFQIDELFSVQFFKLFCIALGIENKKLFFLIFSQYRYTREEKIVTFFRRSSSSFEANKKKKSQKRKKKTKRNEKLRLIPMHTTAENNFNRLTIIFDPSCLYLCSLRLCFLCLSLRLCACFRKKKVRKKTSKTFILKLLFAFVQTVAFQTSLRSYGSRRSWCFLLLSFDSKRRRFFFVCFRAKFREEISAFSFLK